MKVAIYCRVSTRDKGQETANQRLQLEQFARKQGWKVVKVYEDRVSGKRGESGREAFKEMAASGRGVACPLAKDTDEFDAAPCSQAGITGELLSGRQLLVGSVLGPC